MTKAEKWRLAGLKSWETRRLKAGQTAKINRPAPVEPPVVTPVEPVLVPPPSLPRQQHVSVADWRPIQFEDIPARDEFVSYTLNLLRQGITNSDRMRDAIRRERRLILTDATGNWNDCPSDKFVNEHAWSLKHLIEQGAIELVDSKEYRLVD